MPYLLIDTATSGNTTLVAAPGVYAVTHVLGLDITCSNTVTVSLYSNTTLLWKTYTTTVAGGGIVLPCYTTSEMFCRPNEALILNLSAPSPVAGSISYVVHGITATVISPPPPPPPPPPPAGSPSLNFSVASNSMYAGIIL